MEYVVGKTVCHNQTDREGVITEISSTLFGTYLTVMFEGMEYLWHVNDVVEEEDSFRFQDECKCDSRDLFNFGCKCGYMMKSTFKKEGV